MRRKEGRKQGQTNNKAKQHSTPKAVTFPKKNELSRVGLEPTTLYTLHSRQSTLPLSYQGSSAGWAQISHLMYMHLHEVCQARIHLPTNLHLLRTLTCGHNAHTHTGQYETTKTARRCALNRTTPPGGVPAWIPTVHIHVSQHAVMRGLKEIQERQFNITIYTSSVQHKLTAHMHVSHETQLGTLVMPAGEDWGKTNF